MIARRLTANNVVKPDATVKSVIAAGQPVVLTNIPTGSEDIKVKLCPDGARPDLILNTALDPGGSGSAQAVPRNSPALLCQIGGAVAIGDVLKVSSGRLVKCAALEQGWFRALQTGAANDMINVEPCDRTP